MPTRSERPLAQERRVQAQSDLEFVSGFLHSARTLGKLLRKMGIPPETAMKELGVAGASQLELIDQFPASRSGWSVVLKPSMPAENRTEARQDIAPGPSGDLLVLTRSLKIAHCYASTPTGTEIVSRNGQPLLTGVVNVAMGGQVSGTSRPLTPVQIETFLGTQPPEILHNGLANLALVHGIKPEQIH